MRKQKFSQKTNQNTRIEYDEATAAPTTTTKTPRRKISCEKSMSTEMRQFVLALKRKRTLTHGQRKGRNRRKAGKIDRPYVIRVLTNDKRQIYHMYVYNIICEGYLGSHCHSHTQLGICFKFQKTIKANGAHTTRKNGQNDMEYERREKKNIKIIIFRRQIQRV